MMMVENSLDELDEIRHVGLIELVYCFHNAPNYTLLFLSWSNT